MKKLIGIILCLAVVAGVGIVIYEKTGGSRVEIEDILPQNVSFYVQLRDVEKNLKELSSMPVWRGISNIDYEVLMKEINMGSQQAMIINLVKTQLMEALNSPLAKRLFGNDVALAIYPFEKDIGMLPSAAEALSSAFIEEVLSGLFLVTRVDPDVQFAEFITRFFKQFGSNVSQGQVEYRGLFRMLVLKSVWSASMIL